MESKSNSPTARLATLAELRKTTLPAFVAPVPGNETLRAWFKSAGVRRFKSNPTCARGGGPVFFAVADVEKLFRSRTLPA